MTYKNDGFEGEKMLKKFCKMITKTKWLCKWSAQWLNFEGKELFFEKDKKTMNVKQACSSLIDFVVCVHNHACIRNDMEAKLQAETFSPSKRKFWQTTAWVVAVEMQKDSGLIRGPSSANTCTLIWSWTKSRKQVRIVSTANTKNLP